MTYILLATYNGARYLPEWIESIQRQTCGRWHVLARDDGSRDGTPELLAQAARRDARFRVLRDGLGNRGAIGNFAVLIEHALQLGARQILLADQDDVWLPEKLQVQLDALTQMEQAHGSDTPLLVHSDMTVVDQRLKVIHRSYYACCPVQPERHDLPVLLLNNHITGCTTLVNRALLERAGGIPARAAMHDWWLALCAAALGEICYVPQPTVLYRQHGDNTVGALSTWQRLSPWRGSLTKRWRRSVVNFQRAVDQLQQFEQFLARQPGTELQAAREYVREVLAVFSTPRPGWQRMLQLHSLGIGHRNVFSRATLAARCWAVGRRQAA